jgi:hypothetical protein
MHFINQSARCTSRTWAVQYPALLFPYPRLGRRLACPVHREAAHQKKYSSRSSSMPMDEGTGYGGTAAPLRLHLTLGGLVRSTIVACTRRCRAAGSAVHGTFQVPSWSVSPGHFASPPPLHPRFHIGLLLSNGLDAWPRLSSALAYISRLSLPSLDLPTHACRDLFFFSIIVSFCPCPTGKSNWHLLWHCFLELLPSRRVHHPLAPSPDGTSPSCRQE